MVNLLLIEMAKHKTTPKKKSPAPASKKKGKKKVVAKKKSKISPDIDKDQFHKEEMFYNGGGLLFTFNQI